jgi:TPR repeat protein
MTATAYETSPRRGRQAGATLAFCLALTVLGLAASAKADALSAAERAFGRQDYARAAPVLLAAAERGVPVAQTYIGYMYQNGFGVPRDYVVAAI